MLLKMKYYFQVNYEFSEVMFTKLFLILNIIFRINTIWKIEHSK